MLKSSVACRHEPMTLTSVKPPTKSASPERRRRRASCGALTDGEVRRAGAARATRLAGRLRAAGRRRGSRLAGAGGPAQSGVRAHAPDCIMAGARPRLGATGGELGEIMGGRRATSGAHGAGDHPERRRDRARAPTAARSGASSLAAVLVFAPIDLVVTLATGVATDVAENSDVLSALLWTSGTAAGHRRHHAEPRLLRRRHGPHRRRRPAGRGGPPHRRDPEGTPDPAPRPREHPGRGADRDRPAAASWSPASCSWCCSPSSAP